MNVKEDDMKLMVNFFSSYFHQDWVYEAKSPADVVTSYLRTAKANEVVRLRDAIVRFARREGTDAELEKKLFSELGCYYSPSADGQSAREWLLGLDALFTPTPDR